MTPKAKAAAKAAPVRSSYNARSLQRRSAVGLLNDLAETVGVKKVTKRTTSQQVEAFVRRLEPRCQAGDLPALLRDAVLMFLSNGGVFYSKVLPASPGDGPDALAADDADADCEAAPPLLRHKLLEQGFRLVAKAFMMTFNSRTFSAATWPGFLRWVKERRHLLGARRWAACWELSEHAMAGAGGDVFHGHAYLWWTDGVGLRRRNTDDLVFDGVRPRVDTCMCQATRGRALRVAAAQGLWYVSVEKSGTLKSAANFVAWRDYVPQAGWFRSLWEAHKLTDEQYAAYSLQVRAGHADRKRDIAEVEADGRRRAVRTHVTKEMARLKDGGVFQDFCAFLEVDEFVRCFGGGPLCRRPLLAIVGGTNLGKSILAADILKRVSEILGVPDYLEVTVEGDAFLDFTDFDVRRHAGVLLDGIGDVTVLKHNREVLQGRPKACKAARSPTMRFSTVYTLCRRAVVATFDLSAANLHMLDTDHWLSNRRNVTQPRLTAPAWKTGPAVATPPPCPRATMQTWSVDNVVSFLQGRDLAGPASSLRTSGMDGADLLTLDEDVLVKDVRVTPFGARKILRARDAFLAGR